MSDTIYLLAFLLAVCLIGMLARYILHRIESKMKSRLIDIEIQTPYNPQTNFYIVVKEDDKFIHEGTLFNDLGQELEKAEGTFKSDVEIITKLIKQHYRRKEKEFVEIEKEVNKALGDKVSVAEIKEKFSKTYEAFELNEILKEANK